MSSKKNLWLIAGLAVLIIGVLVAVGLPKWRAYVIRNQDERLFNKAQALLDRFQAAEALSIIDQRNHSIKEQTPAVHDKWFAIEVKALQKADQRSRLLELFDNTPKDFEKNEEIALLIGRAILHNASFETLDKFRATWHSRESNQSGWFELDVDTLLLKNKRDQAIKMLNSRSFTGAADCGRLMRLALLNIPENVEAASDYLDKAVAADSRNPDVRVFRGELFESYGQLPMARIDFNVAFLVDTNNPVMRDKLGEFYRRNGYYDFAVRTWADGLNIPATSGEIWLKAIFWSRVARTVEFDWKSTQPPYGDLQPFLNYLLALHPGEFWDAAAFEKLSEARRFESQQQAAFWLKMLAALQAKKDDDASQLLQFNKFRPKSWYPDLESVLLRVLNYRKTGELKFPVGLNLPLSKAPAGTRHSFLEQVDSITRNPNQKVPAELDLVLRSDSAFAVVLLASGWYEAALQINPPDVVPAGFPEWVAYGFTQAYNRERGSKAALAFALKQKPTPTLDLLTAEIQIDNGLVDEGLAKLAPLAKLDSEVGSSAAMDMGKAYINIKQFDRAHAAVEGSPRLSQSLAGKELLAGIALMRGDKPAAEAIYKAIENESDDAKIYFGKQAFDQKNWALARKLTVELIQKHPDRFEFRSNLEAINKAEAGK